MDDHEAMRATELGEAAYMEASFTGTTEDVKAALGMSAARIGGGVVTVMADDPTGGFWSRAIGLGMTEPVTESVVDEMIAFAAGAGAQSLVVQIAPNADGPWEQLLADRGIRPSAAWVKCAAPTQAVHANGHTDLRVAQLDPTDAAHYGDVIIEAFEMPTDSALPPWCASQVSIPGFQMYGA